MARIHCKYIDSFNINWDWYDPYIKKNNTSNRLLEVNEANINNYSHILICTPEKSHYEDYKKIKYLGFNGKIFIEKPAVVDVNELYILDDDKVQVGMVERFNPCIDVLKNLLEDDNLISIDFSRCSFAPASNRKVNSFMDVAIHDIDLFFYLFDNLKVSNFDIYQHLDTFFLFVSFNEGKFARFIWSNDTFARERSITLRSKIFTVHCDLIDQVVKKYKDQNYFTKLYVEKSSPIKRELEDFLFHDTFMDTRPSHKFFLSCLDML